MLCNRSLRSDRAYAKKPVRQASHRFRFRESSRQFANLFLAGVISIIAGLPFIGNFSGVNGSAFPLDNSVAFYFSWTLFLHAWVLPFRKPQNARRRNGVWVQLKLILTESSRNPIDSIEVMDVVRDGRCSRWTLFAMDVVRGGTEKDAPKLFEFELPERSAITFKDDSRGQRHADPWTVGA